MGRLSKSCPACLFFIELSSFVVTAFGIECGPVLNFGATKCTSCDSSGDTVLRHG